MAYQSTILAFAGSLRAQSFNKRLIRVAVSGAERAGARVTLITLNDYPLPVFDEDLEQAQGLPQPARALKALFAQHDGLLIAAPEYNSSITGVLKNTIDWVSRTAPGERPLASFAGKAAGLMSASPGALGGLRGLVHVRQILGNIGVLVIPEQVAVPQAHEAFQTDGALKDAKRQAAVEALGSSVVGLLTKLHG